MKFNEAVNQLTWKQIILAVLVIVLVIGSIHEIIFWTYFHEAELALKQVNSQFAEQQKDIQKTLSDSDKEFQVRQKDFEDQADMIGNKVNEAQQNILNYMAQTEIERMAREKSFDQSFKKAPDKMWAQHEKFGNKMEANFHKQSDEMHRLLALEVSKEIDQTRCEMALDKAATLLPAPTNLTLEELQERSIKIRAFQREIAIRENCEAYL